MSLVEGVTILNVIKQDYLAAFILIFIAIALYVFLFFVSEKERKYSLFPIIALIILTIILVFKIDILYVATIDDTVTFKEFDEHYELVSREGDLFYIKEKDKEKEE